MEGITYELLKDLDMAEQAIILLNDMDGVEDQSNVVAVCEGVFKKEGSLTNCRYQVQIVVTSDEEDFQHIESDI